MEMKKTSWAPADDAKTGSLFSILKEQHFDVVELKETIEKTNRFLVSPLMWL